MKTRLFFAALLLLAFGTMRAQVNEPKPMDPQTDSIMKSRMAEITQAQEQFSERMRELGMNLQYLSDSIDWKTFEQDMEQWGAEMEEWGRKMEQWGAEFEKQFEKPFNNQPSKKDDSQVHAIQVEGSGDVRIEQVQDGFSLRRGNKETSHHYVTNGTLILSGSSDYDVAIQQLDEVILRSSGDVKGKSTLKGRNLKLMVLGSGDLSLNVDYDTIRVEMLGSGDVTLAGQCKAIYGKISGSGDLHISQLRYAESDINATGSGEVWANKSNGVIHQKSYREKNTQKRSLLFDAHWNGFEAGLNMLVDPTMTYVYNNPNGTTGMEIRPLRSWYFGFNIADVGIAFDRRHRVGLFTGVGLGWNNFSWNNDIKIGYDPETDGYTVVPIVSDQVVKNSKYGALFLQVPLMFEVRPTRHMYIDAGVTGGLRIAQWNRVKYENGNSDKQFYGGIGSGVRLFKLDASFRVGGENIGFFANYALLPIFEMSNAKVHPINFGFSINF